MSVPPPVPDPAASPVAPSNPFARAFHASPALMAIARVADGRIIEVNEAFYHGAGYTRAEVIGRTSLELKIWPNPEHRVAFMARLKEKGHVRDYEAVFFTKLQEPRYVSLNADIFEHNGEPCMLMTAIDMTERRRREQVQDATYQISRVLVAGGDLPALFAELHRIIAGLLPARNFYVATLGQGDGLIHFPYFVDELIPAASSRKPANGLTEHVLETGQAVRATHAELVAILTRRGPYTPLERPAAVRLAAPLLIDGCAVGVLAVQDYNDPQAYSDDDRRLLSFVADQAAAAVHRRLGEARERESQEFFVKSFQTTPALMIIARLSDGHILEANAGFERASGYTRAEALGRSTLELSLWTDPRERDRFVGLMEREGRVRDFEGVFRNRHGEIRPFLLNADVFEMHGTKCMLTVGVDITERRRQLQVQDATYRIAQAVLAGGDLTTLFAEIHRIVAGLLPARNFYVATLSPDGTLLSFPYFVDETAPQPPPRKRGFGLTEYVLHTGRPILTTADELTVLRRDHHQYSPTGKPAALWLGAPLLIEGRAFGVIAVQDYHNPAAYGEEDKRLLTFVASQTAAAVQRRQAEEALQRAEQQYRGIFENALEGLYQTTPEGRFIRVNAAMARILGYASPDALLAANRDLGCQLYADPGRRVQFLELMRQTDTLPDFESEVLRADGSRIRLNESVRAVRNAAGEVSHYEGVAIDVTNAHETARTLRAARDAADAANRAKSQFLASMSHELRTPLNGILGYTQILHRDAALTAKQRDGVGIIHQSAEHLLALINDVLDLAKIEARKLVLHPAEFDLPEFVRAVEAVFHPRARDKNLLLETAFAAHLPPVVVGDAQRLRQVVFNLLSNAVKFTRHGGVIFSVEPASAGRIRFSVSDSGPGIATEEQSRLFEPFAQIGDHRMHAEGTGLGLNVSRGIVEQMGGILQVESRAGWGSRFWFEIPLPAATGAMASPVATPRQIIGYNGARRSILVADDNPTNARLLIDILEPLGFGVTTAVDGVDAVEQAKAARPDLVLLDLRMPRLDGFGAARAITEAFPDNAPKMIGVSASAFEPDREACRQAGCADFLAKPFREEQLFAALERQLGLKWCYADAATRETASPFPSVQHAPEAADAEALFELASKGDVVGVRALAQKLAERDPRLAPFAQGVTELAARFKMKAIRQFVDRYRGKPGS